ncbi:MAG: sigma-54-dependent Fis family transcriptional regulator [Methylocystaceae bacterium]
MDNRDLRIMWEGLHANTHMRKLLRPEIAQSWERSYEYQVNPELKENCYICTQLELSEAQNNSRYLIDMALPVINSLSAFVAGTGFVVCLTDDKLCALQTVGDVEAMAWADRGKIVIGSNWPESMMGTNAGALSIILGQPISVTGYEHFCMFCHVAACSFCPITDDGKIIGTLGMIAPHNRFSNHTLGMVVAAVKHIESNITLDRANRYHQIIMESMFDGVMVVDFKGRITFINSKCASLLFSTCGALMGHSIYDLLKISPDNQYLIDLITQKRNIHDEPVSLVIGKDRVSLNITCNTLKSHNDTPGGTVVIIRESHRLKSMVRNMVGGNAQKNFDDLVGNHEGFRQTINNARVAAAAKSNVLLLGESGTGKDILAQAMHNGSPRHMQPFVAVNCAALPRELIASELFGYDEGAFTGARKGGNMGKFELAGNGTIFLDEIGDMPLDLQATLLRVLDDKQIMRLGGNKVIPMGARIIAATNRNLEADISKGLFRRDLYYRLGVIKITLPPLRERGDDILLLANLFLDRICTRLNKPRLRLAPEVEQAFINYHWPGNVRELQNLIEGAVSMVQGSVITLDLVLPNMESPASSGLDYPTGNLPQMDADQHAILASLLDNRFNKTKTAEALGISRRTLYRRLKDLGLLKDPS